MRKIIFLLFLIILYSCKEDNAIKSNWTELKVQIENPFSVCFTDKNNGYIVGSGILKTTDEGLSWSQVKTNSNTCELIIVF